MWLTWDDIELLLLTLPTTAWYICFTYMPMFGIVIAFKADYRPVKGQTFFQTLWQLDWVGLDNLKFLTLSPDTGTAIRNTIIYNVIFIILGMVVAVTMAVLISQLYSDMLRKVCQTMMFLPHFLSWVVVSYFAFAFLSQTNGLINRVIEGMGGEGIKWYAAPEYWPYILVFMNVWKHLGYNMVVYLATLSGIDGTYYEAALIDGATKWQQIKHITLPMLKGVMIILFIMAVGRIFNSDFGLFYQLPRNSGQLYEATLTLDVFVYNALMTLNRPNMAQAAAVAQSVCGCITISLANWIVTKIDSDSALF